MQGQSSSKGASDANVATKFAPGVGTYMTKAEIMEYAAKRLGSSPLSETMLRILALSGLVGFLGTKLIRYAQKPKPKKPRPDVATAPEDELDQEARDLQVMP